MHNSSIRESGLAVFRMVQTASGEGLEGTCRAEGRKAIGSESVASEARSQRGSSSANEATSLLSVECLS